MEARWVRQSPQELAFEYKIEYALPSRGWDRRAKVIGALYPIFKSEQDFIEKISSAPIFNLPSNKFDTVHNLTECDSLRELKDLVASYQYPRDVDGIVAGFNSGKPMSLPIVIGGSKGAWILSGNTRLNVARILNVPAKVIL